VNQTNVFDGYGLKVKVYEGESKGKRLLKRAAGGVRAVEDFI
jgi:hypothetical protein